jgi:hypothetical protein
MSALMPASFWAVEVWPVFSTKQGQTVSCDKMIAEELDCQLNITTSGCREKYNTNGEQYPIGVPESGTGSWRAMHCRTSARSTRSTS